MKTRLSVLKIMVVGLALFGLLPAMVSIVEADVEPAPAGILSVGRFHNCALRPRGAVDCWGWDVMGQVSGTTANVSFATHPGPYAQVSAGEWHTCALELDGAADCWGWNYYGQATDQPGPYVEVSAGESHTCALTPLGAVDCWGNNSDGRAADQTGPYTEVSAGQSYTCALTVAGAVDCWGLDNFGEAADQTGPFTEVSAGQWHTCALKAAGVVDCWGSDEQSQVTGARDLSDPTPYPLFAIHPGPYIQVSAKAEHTCALTPLGGVDCWGLNTVGESDDKVGPYTRVGAGKFHTCALTPLGAVDCWGYNSDGQTNDQSGPYGPYNPTSNTAPTANPGGPYLGAVNTAIQFDGSLSSDPENDPLDYAWSFGDGSTATGTMPNHTYTAAGLYNVCLTVNDRPLSSDESCTLAVVYDPSAGFVTGGGWIDSPAGAYRADPTLSGQATFGFIAKYKKGEPVPSGSTAFEFDLAGMAFASQSYEWLVVNQGGTNAQFKGSGLINGLPDPNGNAYKFMLWAGDDSPDTLRIRIWWEDAAGEHDVYENGGDQVIGAGNIVVHTGN